MLAGFKHNISGICRANADESFSTDKMAKVSLAILVVLCEAAKEALAPFTSQDPA